MMLRTKKIVAFCFLLLFLTVLSVVEGTEENNSPEKSSIVSSLSEEEMVCPNTESGYTCFSNAAVRTDDVQNQYEFDEDDEDEHYDENDDGEEEEYDDQYDDDEFDDDEFDDDKYDEDEYDEDFYDEDNEEFVQRIIDDDECIDEYDDCQHWAEQKPSECVVNPDFMLHKCRLACRVCAKQ